MRKIIAFCLAGALVGCSTTMSHFSGAQATPLDYSVPNIKELLGPQHTYVIRNITNNNYDDYGYSTGYYWETSVVLPLSYGGLLKLPFKNPDDSVRQWVSEVLTENGVKLGAPADFFIDVHVDALKLVTVRNQKEDYKACFVTLQAKVFDSKGNEVKRMVWDGASNRGVSDVKIMDQSGIRMTIAFYPDDPPVCKLSTAVAIRNSVNQIKQK